MIIISELGDKTFLIAALMAMSHPRGVVFSAAFGALLVMSVLSAALGHAVPHLSTPPSSRHLHNGPRPHTFIPSHCPLLSLSYVSPVLYNFVL